MFQTNDRTSFQTKYTGVAVATVSNTVTETSIVPSGVGSLVMPADWMKPGNTARLVMRGLVTTPLIPGMVTFKLKSNGTTWVTGATTALLGSATDAGFLFSETITIMTTGATGTASIAGEVRYPAGILSTKSTTDMIAKSVTLNTTVDQAISVTGQWSLNSHKIDVVTCTFELLEPML